MNMILETGLIILFLALVALGIAILGDHVSNVLSRHDSWPEVKTTRKSKIR